MKNSTFKKALSVLLAVLTLASFSLTGFAAGNAEKVTVTASSNGASVLTGKVYDDYTASLSIIKGTTVNAGEVTASIAMTDIASLGIAGTKSYTKTIKTGIEKEVLLDNYLPSFTSASIVGTIDGQKYGYNITATNGEEVYAIDAVPQNKAAVQAAWAKLASHIKTSTQEKDDSYAVIPASTYVQVGSEKLSFVTDLKLDNIENGAEAAARNAAKLENAKELEDAQAEIYLPAGTTLALGQTVAALKDAASVKIYGYKDSADVNEILSTLRDCKTTEEIIKTLVLFLSDAADAIDGQALTVNITFENAATPPESVKTITLSETDVKLIIGEELTIEATIAPDNAVNNALTWTSSNEYVATVDENGKITAVGSGDAVITATAANGVNAECNVNVGVPYTEIIDSIFSAITGWYISIISIFTAIISAFRAIFDIIK